MKKTFASLTEDTRESLLNLAADAVSELHRHKSKFEESADDGDDEPAPSAKSGDFIYDFARLNLQYLNQLASLNSNYSALGARALEKLHSYFLAPAKHDESAELTVTNKGATLCSVRVENPFAKRALVSVQQAKLQTKNLAPGDKGPLVTAAAPQSVGPGKTLTFTVTASSEKSRAGKTYEFALPVKFTAGGRTITDNLKIKVRRVRS